MHLWHNDLIKVLPREQLVAQWREVSAIVGAIQKNGTPNHILVNFVLDYDFDHLISYAYYIRQEMTKRGYRTMNSVWDKMTDVYFMICYHNILEKAMCGGIPKEDWDKISEVSINKVKNIDYNNLK